MTTEIAHGVTADLRVKRRAIGSVIGGVGGAVYVFVNADALPPLVATTLRVLAAAALVWLVVRSTRLNREPQTVDATSGSFGHGYWFVVAALHRWGLLDRLLATGCPPITRYSFDFGPLVIAGTPDPVNGNTPAYCPRRTVLDKLIVDAAGEAGVEVREGFSVHELLVEDGRVVGIRGSSGEGRPVVEHARVVIGADGAHSKIAEAVAAPTYQDQPMLTVGYYSYWSGFPVENADWVVRPGGHGYGAFPTHDGLTMVLAGWPNAERSAVKADLENNYLRAIREAYGDRLAGACREERVVGGGSANHFRKAVRARVGPCR